MFRCDLFSVEWVSSVQSRPVRFSVVLILGCCVLVLLFDVFVLFSLVQFSIVHFSLFICRLVLFILVWFGLF